MKTEKRDSSTDTTANDGRQDSDTLAAGDGPKESPYSPASHPLVPATDVEIEDEADVADGVLAMFSERMDVRTRRRRSSGSKAWVEDAFDSFLAESSTRNRAQKRAPATAEKRSADLRKKAPSDSDTAPSEA